MANTQSGYIPRNTSGYLPHNLQFKVDDTEMIAGETVLTITVNNGVTDLESVSVDGQEIYPNLADRFSYTIVYNPTSIVITFNQGVISEQIFKIKYFTN